MKGLIFGAGNIGRGFLGLLLHEAGFDVTFVDTDTRRISDLNAHREYPVYIVSKDGVTERIVRSVLGVAAQDIPSVVEAITEADIILTAVGKDALRFVAPTLAHGLMERHARRPGADLHVAVVACENVQDNTTYLRALVQSTKGYEASLSSAFSFPDCVVDRIVPNTLPVRSDSPLAVAVEAYFQLEVDAGMLKAAFPPIPGIRMSQNLTATLEQKLCTLNMAHAITGYFGYARGCKFVHEAIAEHDIASLLDGALEEVEAMLVSRHPTIDRQAQKAYADSVKKRFANPHLRDEVTRVARQPKRKLGSEDRLVKPAVLLSQQGGTPAFLATGIAAALHFDSNEDAEAQDLVTRIRTDGISRVLHEVSGLPHGHHVMRLAQANYLLRSL